MDRAPAAALQAFYASPWPTRLLAALAGALLVFAFAPFEWRLLSIASPALLLCLWLKADAGEAFRRGYWFGLGFFGLGISWVFVSFRVFGGAPLWLAAGLTLTFVLTLALFPAGAGYLANRLLPARPGLRLLLGYPAAWVLLEWLRSWILTGFPWLLLGQAQLDTPLSGFVPVFGELGASAAAMLSAALLVWLWMRRSPVLVAGLALALWGGGAALERVRWTYAHGDPLQVSLVQGNIPQDMKWDPEQRARTLELYRDLTRAHWDSKLIIWPESAVPAYYLQAQEFLDALDAEARDQGSLVITGIFHYDPERDLAYNAFMSLGEGRQYYYKRHLVPFGEYLPLRFILDWIGGLLVIPMSDLSAGQARPLMHFPRFSLGLSICYEDAYGSETIDALPEADLLVNGSNDAWFGNSFAPHQHLEIARLRALETGRYLLRATNTGVSAIIGPAGEVVAQSPQFKTHVLSAPVRLRQGLTPFARYGRWPILALAVLMLAAGVLLSRRAVSGRKL